MKSCLLFVFTVLILVLSGCAPTSSLAPPVGRLVMIESAYAPGETLDLPMRVLAWEGEMGKSFLAYLAPAALADRYDIAGQAETVARMAAALEALTGAAVK